MGGFQNFLLVLARVGGAGGGAGGTQDVVLFLPSRASYVHCNPFRDLVAPGLLDNFSLQLGGLPEGVGTGRGKILLPITQPSTIPPIAI